MNIAEILCRHAAERPNAPAILDVRHGRERVLTFAGLEQGSRRVAALLDEAHIGAGDAVLLLQPMSAELYAAVIAVFRRGAIAMFLDPSAGRAHIEHSCEIWPPKVLVANWKAHFLRAVSPALRRIPVKISIGRPMPGAISWSRARLLAPASGIHRLAPEAPALVTFTSGSTGRPKAAVRTHSFLLAQHRVLAESLKLRPGDVDLATLPIFVLANLGSGVTSLIPNADLRFPGAIQPAAILAQIAEHKPVSTAASPAFLERLADFCRSNSQTLETIRKIFVGGAPVFPKLLHKLHKVAPRAEITAVYGSTEAEPIAEVDYSAIHAADFNAMLSGRGLLAGKPVSAVCLAVLRDHWGSPVGPYTQAAFAAECLPVGEAGEIVVSGDHVLPGYLHGRGDEETKFEVAGTRWHRTGDAGFLDSQGRLWLLGRCQAQIQDGKGVLYPFTVECAAQEQSGVRRAAVVSHHGRRLLVVELEKGANEQELAGLKERLAWAKIEEIRKVRRIPMDKRHNAKIDYPALQKLLGSTRVKHPTTQS